MPCSMSRAPKVKGLDLVDGTPVLNIKPDVLKPNEYYGFRGGRIEDDLENAPENYVVSGASSFGFPADEE